MPTARRMVRIRNSGRLLCAKAFRIDADHCLAAVGGLCRRSAPGNPYPPTAPAAEAAGQPASEVSLTTQPWQWHGFSGAVEQFTVETPESYRLTFNEDGIVDIVADCNTAIGSYKIESLDGGTLSIDVAPKTTDLCPPESRGAQFLSLLGGAARLFLRGRQALHRPDGRWRDDAAKPGRRGSGQRRSGRRGRRRGRRTGTPWLPVSQRTHGNGPPSAEQTKSSRSKIPPATW